MSYKFIRVTDYYSGFLKTFYGTNLNSAELDYEAQYSQLTEQSIEIVSSYGKYFRLAGVDAVDIISNASLLLKRWAKENGIDQNLSDEAIVVAQIKHFKPDIVWIDTTRFLNKKWLNELRNEVKSIKLLVGHVCAPYNQVIFDGLSQLDIVFTCTPGLVKEFKEKGINNVELVYHSFNHSVLETIQNTSNPFPDNNFVFTGSLTTGYGFHGTRIKYIEAILNSGIDMTIYGNLESTNRIFLKKSFSTLVKTMNSLGLNSLVNSIPLLNKHKKHAEVDINFYSNKLKNSVKSPVFGMDMYRVLAKSKMCFNIHGEIANQCAGNLRLFEATGVGSCLITDNKQNMGQLFEIDKEVVVYDSIEECIEKVKWLLHNPEEMKRIAEAGQKRTLKEHTVENRVNTVNKIFKDNL
ncbi:MAG: glycosyltransferase [Flavobacteriales bacterium]|nr:glycosyltransferase [Flavobacteriales bacterium]MCW8914057.1 glycosyltransferase [Flavobacteriales bacterium]MCW8938115.1 glycosyltransferase [Flavobacteriales bacterium]MCW8968891.1 glycosyltransferase [Flavobacteriales bacterium]MCW8991148.1 glycosyltransferase [Flavobacteriales bacterium]